MATLLNVSGVTINTPNTVSPIFTFPSIYEELIATLTLQAVDATDSNLTINMNVQRSPDGGSSWLDYFQIGWGGGPNSGTGPSIQVDNAMQFSGAKGRAIITPSRQITNVAATVTGT